MSTKDYFLYYLSSISEDLECDLCSSAIQVAEIYNDDLHYRCVNKDCYRHANGETVKEDNYPQTWVKIK
jgi:hypothetical protein